MNMEVLSPVPHVGKRGDARIVCVRNYVFFLFFLFLQQAVLTDYRMKFCGEAYTLVKNHYE